MTQEEIDLLLKDLCARLPYGVKVLADIDKTFDGGCIGIINKIEPYVGDKFPELKGQYLLYAKGCLTPLVVDEVRPYLRPMSSMRKDEKEYIKLRWCYNDWDIYGPSSLWREKIDVEDAKGIIDYFNEHHFDYRGLIEKDWLLKHLMICIKLNRYDYRRLCKF